MLGVKVVKWRLKNGVKEKAEVKKKKVVFINEEKYTFVLHNFSRFYTQRQKKVGPDGKGGFSPFLDLPTVTNTKLI